jgi:molybdate transport system substrate-binding protein
MTVRPWRIAAVFIASHLATSIAAAEDILIFAAASTAPALEEVIHQSSKDSGDRVRASYASSGALARQLDNGAPASLYLSANTKWMDWAEKNDLLADGMRTDLLRNRLVLVQPNTGAFELVHRDLVGSLNQVQGERLAIADPAHAPAGEYAKAALTSLGLWKSLSRQTVRAQNVRAALLLVERKEAPFGIVYQTDAQASKAVRIIGVFPEDSHPPILYGLAIIRNKDNAAARRFYNILKSPNSKKIFRRFGFLPP